MILHSSTCGYGLNSFGYIILCTRLFMCSSISNTCITRVNPLNFWFTTNNPMGLLNQTMIKIVAFAAIQLPDMLLAAIKNDTMNIPWHLWKERRWRTAMVAFIIKLLYTITTLPMSYIFFSIVSARSFFVWRIL